MLYVYDITLSNFLPSKMKFCYVRQYTEKFYRIKKWLAHSEFHKARCQLLSLLVRRRIENGEHLLSVIVIASYLFAFLALISFGVKIRNVSECMFRGFIHVPRLFAWTPWYVVEWYFDKNNAVHFSVSISSHMLPDRLSKGEEVSFQLNVFFFLL